MGSKRYQVCSPCGSKRQPMSFITFVQIIPYSEESLKNIAKVSDPIYELL